MLGTPPSGARPLIQRLSVDVTPDIVPWVDVNSLELHRADPEKLVAFAMDQPQMRELLRGAGFEINGWVIDSDTPVPVVRTNLRDGNGLL